MPVAMINQRVGIRGRMDSRLCFGIILFGAKGERGADERAAQQPIGRFLDTGGSVIDTADVCRAC